MRCRLANTTVARIRISDADWFDQTAIPFLIGTKFDTFSTFPRDEQEEITKQVRT